MSESPYRSAGPWDAAENAPAMDRVDLGGLQVPIRTGLEVQVNIAEDQVVAATVLHGPTALQVQAFAAAKSGGLWDEVRREIIEEIGRQGGQVQEVSGPFGVELRARVPVEAAGQTVVYQPARFIGVDGPRWFLRGVISGQGAEETEAAATLEEAFRNVVVVRGDHPLPPKELIELRLPPEARTDRPNII